MTLPFVGNLHFGLLVGFVATLAIASALNEFGDEMFKRGVARPFFFGKHRLHHRSFLFIFLPLGYVALSFLILLGYIQIVWNDFWTGMVSTIAIATACLLLDLAVDRAKDSGGWGFIHHELIYLAVPAFAFSNFLRFTI